MTGGGSVVGLDFDNRQAWPGYDWMGVAKAALESTSRYLARDLGPDNIRVNLVCAGPLRTVAARGVPGFDRFEDVWSKRAPLGWDLRDPEPVAKACVALLSDWFPAPAGERVHVDAGFHAIAAAGDYLSTSPLREVRTAVRASRTVVADRRRRPRCSEVVVAEAGADRRPEPG